MFLILDHNNSFKVLQENHNYEEITNELDFIFTIENENNLLINMGIYNTKQKTIVKITNKLNTIGYFLKCYIGNKNSLLLLWNRETLNLLEKKIRHNCELLKFFNNIVFLDDLDYNIKKLLPKKEIGKYPQKFECIFYVFFNYITKINKSLKIEDLCKVISYQIDL
jgi:hypothetical protein